MGTIAWRLIGAGAALAAGAIASKVVTTGWRFASGHDAPVDPAKPDDSTWKEALLFAAITGIVVQAARVAAERKAAEYYRKSTGHLPGE
ncbi:MAG: DUF4235 domain-containing protein [Actinomycetota bacterium]|nr:DUF4235 domain-containing protein [Actinomycetota bacterium]